MEVFETAAGGAALHKTDPRTELPAATRIRISPEHKYQTLTGFGGSFTEASAYVFRKLGPENRKKILDAYFGADGACYSLTRMPIGSCDFSLGAYSHAPVARDHPLSHFTIDRDKTYLIPFIREAIDASETGFKIIASPWTAPPWMKDNASYIGGKLLPEYRQTWALYFSRFLDAYQAEGIPIWGVTVENEPLGNGNNWESMHFEPEEMTAFVQDYLGPTLRANGQGDIRILGYDQNREHLATWVDAMYRTEASARYFAGTAVHWYASTFDVFPGALEYARAKAPDKHLIQTEACVDAEVPRWHDDAWYWSQEATDWGWDWAPEEQKKYHPKYVPVYRYASDIIGCLNHGVDGWIDWNMVLDRQGGPNWAENWCVAPIIADPEADEVYVTPLYFILAHFSRFIRPGARRIGWERTDQRLQVTAAENPDGSIAVVVLNPEPDEISASISLGDQSEAIRIPGQALQTVRIVR